MCTPLSVPIHLDNSQTRRQLTPTIWLEQVGKVPKYVGSRGAMRAQASLCSSNWSSAKESTALSSVVLLPESLKSSGDSSWPIPLLSSTIVETSRALEIPSLFQSLKVKLSKRYFSLHRHTQPTRVWLMTSGIELDEKSTLRMILTRRLDSQIRMVSLATTPPTWPLMTPNSLMSSASQKVFLLSTLVFLKALTEKLLIWELPPNYQTLQKCLTCSLTNWTTILLWMSLQVTSINLWPKSLTISSKPSTTPPMPTRGKCCSTTKITSSMAILTCTRTHSVTGSETLARSLRLILVLLRPILIHRVHEQSSRVSLQLWTNRLPQSSVHWSRMQSNSFKNCHGVPILKNLYSRGLTLQISKLWHLAAQALQ